MLLLYVKQSPMHQLRACTLVLLCCYVTMMLKRKNVPYIVKISSISSVLWMNVPFVNTVKTSAVPEEIKVKHCLIRCPL